MYGGDMYDDIKTLLSRGLSARIIAKEVGWSSGRYLRDVMNKSRRFQPAALSRFKARRDYLFALVKEAEQKRLYGMTKTLAIYFSATERVLLNKDYPFGWIPTPKDNHLEKAREVAKGGVSALALELLKLDFLVKKKLHGKMDFLIKYGAVKSRIDINTWRGLFDWLDTWRKLLKNSKKNQEFLKHCITKGEKNAELEAIHDERSEMFERIIGARERKKQSVNRPCLTLSITPQRVGRKKNAGQLRYGS